MSGTTVKLDAVPNGKRVVVRSIGGGRQLRQKLNNMGIHAGDEIMVKRSGIFKGPLVIQVHGMEMALGRGMAGKITVEETA